MSTPLEGIRFVTEDDYREAVAYASAYFVKKWGLLDEDRFVEGVTMDWCEVHNCGYDSDIEGDDACELGWLEGTDGECVRSQRLIVSFSKGIKEGSDE